MVKSLVKAPSSDARAKLPGMDPKRADIILGGAIILEQVFEELDIEAMVYSDYALREGVLLDAWQRHHGGSLHHLSDLRRRSVLHLAEQMDEDKDHSNHVAPLRSACSTRPSISTGWATMPGSTWRRRPCCATWGCSCRTPATTGTATT